MTTTPPVRPIVEPPTPLHGGRFDEFHPATQRKSARFSNRSDNRTPSPTGTGRATKVKSASTPRRSTRNISSSHTYSPPSSTNSSPQTMSRKRARPGHDQTKNLLGQDLVTDPQESASAGMLPTPAKTPRKKEVKPLASAARVLFPSRPETIEEAMPNPRKRSRKNIGYSLSSFDDPSSDSAGIEIFTDSKDKQPEVDESADNPFYVKPGAQKRTRKNKASKATETSQLVQEALERDEGMVYVFRGKKVYRKFGSDEVDAIPDGAEEGLNLDQFETPRHFTRSSVKPRLLFPSASKEVSSLTDEEAPTDIEDQVASEPEVDTPSKPRFAPATPPDTNRAKRTVKKPMDNSPAVGDSDEDDVPGTSTKQPKRPSPFMNWQRVKASSSAKGKKRGGEELTRGEESKKVKG